MIETALFLLLLATLGSMRSTDRRRTIGWFLLSAAGIAGLAVHHMTDPLRLSF